MSLLSRKPGMLTTVQDLGRNGYRRFGINPNGAMDRTAVRLINTLLGNDENTATLEMHFPATEILFQMAAWIALGGAEFSAMINGEAVERWTPFYAEKGTVLSFAGKKMGNRCYLAVKGGFGVTTWLDSSSTNLTAQIGGFEGRKLAAGDMIELNKPDNRKNRRFLSQISPSLIPHYSPFPTVRITMGGEYELLTPASRELLVSENFTISNNSSRMGFRLSGEGLVLREPMEMLSSAVDFGTIQMLPDGQLIVLMADHQTAGGYPRVGQIISFDLPLIAQLGAGDKVGFHLVEHRIAEELLFQFETDLNFLKVGCKLQ